MLDIEKGDLSRLQGVWLVAVTSSPFDLPPESIMRIDGDVCLWMYPDSDRTYRLELHSQTSPKGIDFCDYPFRNDASQSNTQLGVYDMLENEVTVTLNVYAEPEDVRPDNIGAQGDRMTMRLSRPGFDLPDYAFSRKGRERLLSSLAGEWIAPSAKVWSGSDRQADLQILIKDTGYIEAGASDIPIRTWGIIGIEPNEEVVDVSYSERSAAPAARSKPCPIFGLMDFRSSVRACFLLQEDQLTFEMIHDPGLDRPWSHEKVVVTYQRKNTV